MKALAWGLWVLVVFVVAGVLWNRAFRIHERDRFGFYLWAIVGVFTALLAYGIMASE